MVQDDSSAAATKQDVQLILQEIKDVKVLMLAQDEMLQEQINVLPTKEDLQRSIVQSEQHMLAAMETLRYDMIGIHTDKIEQHEDRLVALEVVTGLRR